MSSLTTCNFPNISQTGLEKNVFGNHFVTVPKADAGTPPAFASDPLKRLSGSGESNGANTVNFSKDATLSSVVLSKEDNRPAGMYSAGTPSHVEPEIVEIDGPSPITTQLQEQEPNFIRSPSPHGVSHDMTLFVWWGSVCLFFSFCLRTALVILFLLLCSLVPQLEKVLTMLRDKVQRCLITLMMKMQTAKSILKGVSRKHQLSKNYVLHLSLYQIQGFLSYQRTMFYILSLYQVQGFLSITSTKLLSLDYLS